jgi:hypothetical protein
MVEQGEGAPERSRERGGHDDRFVARGQGDGQCEGPIRRTRERGVNGSR